jgi:hypothetical protein
MAGSHDSVRFETPFMASGMRLVSYLPLRSPNDPSAR